MIVLLMFLALVAMVCINVPIAIALSLAAVLGKHVISGQVDRLLVEAERVLVVDYKSGRAAPEDDSAIPEAYLAQMADYRAVLRAIFPGREIRSALLFTDGPALIWLRDALLDAHAP